MASPVEDVPAYRLEAAGFTREQTAAILGAFRSNAATKVDLLEFEKRLDARITEEAKRLDTRITEEAKRLDARITEEIGRLDVRITEEIGRLDTRITKEVSRLDERLNKLDARITKEANGVKLWVLGAMLTQMTAFLGLVLAVVFRA